MSVHRYDEEDLFPLLDLLSLFPGVKPRITREQILFGDLSESLASHVIVGIPYRITPEGTQLLIEKYRGRGLPMKSKSTGVVPEEVLRYALSGDALEARKAKRRVEAEAYRALIRNPSLINPETFSYKLLNDVFFALKGAGEGSLEIGGVVVTKHLQGYQSNSGRNRDYAVSFTWTDPTTKTVQEIAKESRYANNRRNDADRNWGLGRE